jgi:hypothetical protein
VECTHIGHLSKLKRLFLDNNLLINVNLSGLTNLEHLSLSSNRLNRLNDMSDLRKLVYLDLSGNKLDVLGSNFSAEIQKLKSLRVLDLSSNGFDVAINIFYQKILVYLKRLPKLEFLSFDGNPIEESIFQFRGFVVNEMPKLKYLDWDAITKEVKIFLLYN